jgi:hypothetical protein
LEAIQQSEMATLNWTQWQLAVLNVLRRDLGEVLPYINLDEVDWDSWRSYFKTGCQPQVAVNRALERGY